MQHVSYIHAHFTLTCTQKCVTYPPITQTESASEGVRALTQSTGKRVDEHAAAIQRLTLVRES